MIAKETKHLLENFLSLSFLQGFSRVLPLVTTPFLFLTIGQEHFGVIEFVKAICFYFVVFIEFGFNYSATRQISLYQNDSRKINQIFSCLIVLKTMLILISFSILLLLIHFIPTLHSIKTPFLCYFPVVVAMSFFPIWLFQGLEKMKTMTVINVVSKLLFLIGLFIFIRKGSNFLIYPIALSIAEILRVGFALFYAIKKFNLKFLLPSFEQLLFQIKDSMHIFLSNASISIYSRFPQIFLGGFIGPNSVAIYSVGIRVVRSLTGFVEPLTQSIFPTISKKMFASLEEGVKQTMNILKLSSLITLILGFWIFIFAKPIIFLMSGHFHQESIEILRISSFLPCIIVISNIVGIQILINLNRRHEYALTMFLAGLFCAAFLYILVPASGATGAAVGILLTELFATLLMCVFGTRAVMNQKKMAILNTDYKN